MVMVTCSAILSKIWYVDMLIVSLFVLLNTPCGFPRNYGSLSFLRGNRVVSNDRFSIASEGLNFWQSHVAEKLKDIKISHALEFGEFRKLFWPPYPRF